MADPNNKLAFLGRGLGFPPTFDKQKKDVEMIDGELDIKQSLEIILSTEPGERILEPDFGCNLQQMLFENLNLTMVSLMEDIVETALIFHEPRIEVNSVTIETDEVLGGKVLIKVDYTIPSTNSRFNFVFPFYLEEGTDLEL